VELRLAWSISTLAVQKSDGEGVGETVGGGVPLLDHDTDAVDVRVPLQEMLFVDEPEFVAEFVEVAELVGERVALFVPVPERGMDALTVELGDCSNEGLPVELGDNATEELIVADKEGINDVLGVKLIETVPLCVAVAVTVRKSVDEAVIDGVPDGLNALKSGHRLVHFWSSVLAESS
jgi:hypothetical protein